MLDLGTLRIGITADSKDAEKGLEEVKQETKQTEQQTDKSTKKMSSSWSKVGKAAKAVAVAGIAAVGAALAGAANAAVENAADFGKLDTAFTQAGFSAEAANSSFESFVGLMGETDTAIEASNHLAQLCSSEEELTKWSTISAGVFATFGDSLPLEGLTEAANETAKVGKTTGSLADALNWVGISEDEFNAKLAECNSEQERAQLITDTLNEAYKESGEQYLKNNEAITEYNKAMGEAKKTATDLGVLMLPLMSGLLGVANAVGQLTHYMLTSNDSVQTMVSNITGGFDGLASTVPAQIESIVSGFANGFMKIGEVLGGILPSLGSMMGAIGASILQQLPTLLTSIITGLVSMIPGLLQGAINFFMAIVQALPIVIIQLCTQLPLLIQQVINILPTLIPMLINGAIQLFMGLVQALPIILPALIQGMMATIDTVVAMLPTLIPMLLQAAIQLFTALVQSLPIILPALLSAVLDVITSVVSYIPTFVSTMMSSAKTLFMGICDAVPGIASQLHDAIGNLIRDAVNIVSSKASEMLQAGKDLVQGIVNGIKAAPGAVADALRGVIDSGIQAAKNLLGIASPSKLFKKFGEFTIEGFNIGVEANTDDAVRTMTNASRAIATAFDVVAPDVSGQFRTFVDSKRSNNAANGANGSSTNNVITVNNYSPKALSEKESAREYRRSMRQLAMA